MIWRNPKVWIIPLVVVIAFLPLLVESYTVSLINEIGMSTLVALGLVMLTGSGGVTSFGQAAFVGVAAYTSAIVTTKLGLSPWVGLLAALALTSALALVIGALTLRMGGHFLALSTIAWGICVPIIFGSITYLGSHTGILNIPAIHIGDWSLGTPARMYYLVWILVGLAFLLSFNLMHSRTGRVMRSLKGGGTLLASFGADMYRARVILFVYAAVLASLTGWLYAHTYRYVSPSAFNVEVGIEYLLMAIVGGVGSLLGALAGSAVVLELQNILQDFLPLVTEYANHLTVIVFFIIFIVLMQFGRNGVMGGIKSWLESRGYSTSKVKKGPFLDDGDVALAGREKPAKGSRILSSKNLIKQFGGLTAVDDVSFDIDAGDIVGLIGPNGAGKSTMFNMLTRTLKMTTGSIEFMGHDISRQSQRKVACMGMARTFQHVKLMGSMTLLENVALGANVRTHSGVVRDVLRLNKKEEAQIFHEAMRQLERVGLADRAYQTAGQLPLGSQRILEIARALASDPTLLVLDEPAAGLRHQEKIELGTLLRKLREEGMTILIVEHDMDFVMGLVDRLIVMNFGSKLTEGTPDKVRVNKDVQAAYLGGTHE